MKVRDGATHLNVILHMRLTSIAWVLADSKELKTNDYRRGPT